LLKEARSDCCRGIDAWSKQLTTSAWLAQNIKLRTCPPQLLAFNSVKSLVLGQVANLNLPGSSFDFFSILANSVF